MGPIGCTETSVRNYFCSQSDNRENSNLLRGTSLKTRVFCLFLGMKQVSLYIVLFISSFGRVVNRLFGISLKSRAHRTSSVISNCHTRSYRLCLRCDGTRAETRFHLSAKRTSPFKSAGASVQSTAGSRGVRISGSNARYTMFRGSLKGTGYPHH